MKDTMINIMVTMMPAMKPFMWFSTAIALLGFIFIMTNLIFKHKNMVLISWSAKIVLTTSILFFLAQMAGYFLNMPPTINFGDSSKFEFILISFWKIGLVFLLAGIVLRYISNINKTVKA